jgi:hypothetical protein
VYQVLLSLYFGPLYIWYLVWDIVLEQKISCYYLYFVNSSSLRVSPEVVQSQPYGEKADVWAAGCILYQMATLKPPFFSSNMLALATKVPYLFIEFGF